jgi:DNA-binding NarL/FixJ family response regulator
MPERSRVNLLLLDDHEIFREGLRRILAAEPDFRVVASCASADEALRTLPLFSVDIVLLDIELGGAPGGEFLASARKSGFLGKVLVVTAGVTNREAAHLLKWGISGIFFKQNSPGLLIERIRSVMRGEPGLDQETLRGLLEGRPKLGDDVLRRSLSDRQRQVLQLVFEGLANKEIAERLQISEASVKAAIQELFDKSGVRTRSQLVRFAIEKYGDQVEGGA